MHEERGCTEIRFQSDIFMKPGTEAICTTERELVLIYVQASGGGNHFFFFVLRGKTISNNKPPTVALNTPFQIISHNSILKMRLPINQNNGTRVQLHCAARTGGRSADERPSVRHRIKFEYVRQGKPTSSAVCTSRTRGCFAFCAAARVR